MNLEACLSVHQDQESPHGLEAKTHSEPQIQEVAREENGQERTQHYRSQLVISKKIKIKGHQKTETAQETHYNSLITRLKTSPKKLSPLGISDINRNFYASTAGKTSKPFRSHWQLTEKELSYCQNISCNELLPEKKKPPYGLARTQKNLHTISSFLQKDEDRVSSKSKRKIEFTVYQDRGKSLIKENATSSQKPLKLTTSLSNTIPYPCSHSIVIDLFKNPEKNNSKSKQKSLSRQSSLEKSCKLHKTLNKSKSSQILNEKIQKTMQKLSQFQIITDHADTGEIEGMLLGYQIAGEPECKWVLMAIDEIFGKMRKKREQ